MRVTGVHAHTVVAFVTLAIATNYVVARCPDCARPIGAVPAKHAEVRRLAGELREIRASGRGPVIYCAKCRFWCEVIGHG